MKKTTYNEEFIMEHKLIMENWRRYSDLITEQQDQAKADAEAKRQEINKALSDAEEVFNKDMKKLNSKDVEILKNWIRVSPSSKAEAAQLGYDDDEYEYMAGTAKDAADELRQRELDTSFASDKFSIKDVEQDDPELAIAIKAMKGKNIKNSNLLFDGEKLHWRVGREIIFSWRASSGHFEDDVLVTDKRAVKAAIDLKSAILGARRPDGSTANNTDKLEAAMKSLDFDMSKENPNFTRERLYEDLQELIALIDQQKELSNKYNEMLTTLRSREVSKLRASIQDDFKKRLSQVRKEYNKKDRQIKTLVMRYVEFKIDADSKYETSPELRRAKQDIEDKGPTPEGKYIIKSKMQDMTNIISSKPFALSLALVSQKSSIGNYSAWMSQLAVQDEYSGRGDYAWGRFRVRISKIIKKDTSKNFMKLSAYRGKRGGFFIHGGDFRGSSGCIDLGDNMDSFAKFWVLGGAAKVMGPMVKASWRFRKLTPSKSNKKRMIDSYWDDGGWQGAQFQIPLYVKYTEREKRRLVAKNPVVKRFAEYVFGMLPGGVNKFLKGKSPTTTAKGIPTDL